MFDADDYFNMLSSYTTTTDTEKETETQESQTSYGSQTSYNPYSSVQTSFDDDDDYSVTQNYSEEQSYNGTTRTLDDEEETQVQTYIRAAEMPVIKREEPAVNLIKTRQRIELQARMKIILAVFGVTVFALIFAIIYNFISIGKMKSTFAGKEVEISQLQDNINALNSSYIDVRDWADQNDFVEPDESNTVEVEMEEYYNEKVVEEIPSNWFNDVCEFFSKLFAWLNLKLTKDVFVDVWGENGS